MHAFVRACVVLALAGQRARGQCGSISVSRCEDADLSARGQWGVECLLSALDIRFRFHFRSSRKTNRLDKPDWFLSYQLSRLKEHIVFLDSIVQVSF